MRRSSVLAFCAWSTMLFLPSYGYASSCVEAAGSSIRANDMAGNGGAPYYGTQFNPKDVITILPDPRLPQRSLYVLREYSYSLLSDPTRGGTVSGSSLWGLGQAATVRMHSASADTSNIKINYLKFSVKLDLPDAADYVFELQCDLERAQVSGIEPRQAKPGEEVVLSGNAFYGVTHVKFGRTLAQAIVESGERLVVRVPSGARTVPITLLNAQDVEIETDFSFTFESTPEPELHAVPTLSWWGLMLLFSALTGSVGLRLRSKGQAGV